MVCRYTEYVIIDCYYFIIYISVIYHNLPLSTKHYIQKKKKMFSPRSPRSNSVTRIDIIPKTNSRDYMAHGYETARQIALPRQSPPEWHSFFFSRALSRISETRGCRANSESGTVVWTRRKTKPIRRKRHTTVGVVTTCAARSYADGERHENGGGGERRVAGAARGGGQRRHRLTTGARRRRSARASRSNTRARLRPHAFRPYLISSSRRRFVFGNFSFPFRIFFFFIIQSAFRSRPRRAHEKRTPTERSDAEQEQSPPRPPSGVPVFYTPPVSTVVRPS